MSPELLRKPVHYDAVKRRVWIYGQRCHHGATGAVLAAAGATLAALKVPPAAITLVAAGGVLMAHDWHDRAIWFQRGWQNQP
jgi:hypothetical protein